MVTEKSSLIFRLLFYWSIMVHTRSTNVFIAVLLIALAVAYGSTEENDQEHNAVIRNKRGWNGAKGMWGKRSVVEPEDEDAFEDLEKRAWNKASGMWGKRFVDEDEFSPLEEKRAWNKASGMWGKRAGWSGAKGMWGRRKRSL